jgi:hypothetical protein
VVLENDNPDVTILKECVAITKVPEAIANVTLGNRRSYRDVLVQNLNVTDLIQSLFLSN